MVIQRKIDKSTVKDLEKEVFGGRIHVIYTEQETEKAVAFLMDHPIVGIDTETKPSFTKGKVNKVALMQISTEECCFLFRLNRIGFPKPLINLLESKDTVKVGLSLHDDFAGLRKRSKVNPEAVIELQDYVRAFGIKDQSLQKIYAILFNRRISKSQQLSNWESDTLTNGQQSYAATDAWACLKIYDKLQELKRTGDFELAPEIEEEPKEAKKPTAKTTIKETN